MKKHLLPLVTMPVRQSLLIMILLTIVSTLKAQNQIINGDLHVGADTGAVVGEGKKLYLEGTYHNTDKMWIGRYNRASNDSDLRINIGDDYGEPDDRLVIGTRNYVDKQWYTHMIVQGDGKIGVGTQEIGEELLAVKGTIRAKEIKVEGDPWPDYVFDPEYNLRSLSALDNFIQAHSHLPAIPSAQEVSKNGIDLGKMNARLLEKIEELTLYIIQQHKQLERFEEALKQKDVQYLKLEKRLLELEHAPASQ